MPKRAPLGQTRKRCPPGIYSEPFGARFVCGPSGRYICPKGPQRGKEPPTLWDAAIYCTNLPPAPKGAVCARPFGERINICPKGPQRGPKGLRSGWGFLSAFSFSFAPPLRGNLLRREKERGGPFGLCILSAFSFSLWEKERALAVRGAQYMPKGLALLPEGASKGFGHILPTNLRAERGRRLIN